MSTSAMTLIKKSTESMLRIFSNQIMHNDNHMKFMHPRLRKTCPQGYDWISHHTRHRVMTARVRFLRVERGI